MSPEPATPRVLAERFARRMRGVALSLALGVLLAPPAFYWHLSYTHLRAQAEARAVALARPLAALAIRQPGLWRYNLEKVVQATAPQRALGDLGSVQLLDCRGTVLLSTSQLGLHQGQPVGPVGWAPVVAAGRVAAWVAVRMEEAATVADTRLVAALALLCALLAGGLVYFLPVRAVRRQAGDLEDLVRRLGASDARLQEANADLRHRVEGAIAETRALSDRVLSIQEEERRRMARDLHDGVGQQLTALGLQIEHACRCPEGADLGAAEETCRAAMAELRRVVFDLRPRELDSGSLVAALRATCERFELQTGLSVSFRHQGEDEAEPAVAAGLLRILQEALANVARHAGAEEVGVSLAVSDDAIALGVADDGRGFVPGDCHEGSGLRGMRERALFLGGHLEIVSQPGQGTRLAVEVPRPRCRPGAPARQDWQGAPPQAGRAGGLEDRPRSSSAEAADCGEHPGRLPG